MNKPKESPTIEVFESEKAEHTGKLKSLINRTRFYIGVSAMTAISMAGLTTSSILEFRAPSAEGFKQKTEDLEKGFPDLKCDLKKKPLGEEFTDRLVNKKTELPELNRLLVKKTEEDHNRKPYISYELQNQVDHSKLTCYLASQPNLLEEMLRNKVLKDSLFELEEIERSVEDEVVRQIIKCLIMIIIGGGAIAVLYAKREKLKELKKQLNQEMGKNDQQKTRELVQELQDVSKEIDVLKRSLKRQIIRKLALLERLKKNETEESLDAHPFRGDDQKQRVTEIRVRIAEHINNEKGTDKEDLEKLEILYEEVMSLEENLKLNGRTLNK
ncbi:hypothetical protein IT411_03895 [Candidatus Peregrinibacteria bacterium]|nr:hypothetical protein [Candidatus Peregrinibacteria bacterium]